jgi:hypothetical protein
VGTSRTSEKGAAFYEFIATMTMKTTKPSLIPGHNRASATAKHVTRVAVLKDSTTTAFFLLRSICSLEIYVA